MNKQKIHDALSYIHYWEKNKKSRAEAAKEAITINGLNEQEKDILLKVIHVSPTEIL